MLLRACSVAWLHFRLLLVSGDLNYRLNFGKNGPPPKAEELEDEDDDTQLVSPKVSLERWAKCHCSSDNGTFLHPYSVTEEVRQVSLCWCRR